MHCKNVAQVAEQHAADLATMTFAVNVRDGSFYDTYAFPVLSFYGVSKCFCAHELLSYRTYSHHTAKFTPQDLVLVQSSTFCDFDDVDPLTPSYRV